jgi:anaerobic C4-dicarboxylate transporter
MLCPAGNPDTDKEAVEGLIRQYLKQEAQRQVVADRCAALHCLLLFCALCMLVCTCTTTTIIAVSICQNRLHAHTLILGIHWAFRRMLRLSLPLS